MESLLLLTLRMTHLFHVTHLRCSAPQQSTKAVEDREDNVLNLSSSGLSRYNVEGTWEPLSFNFGLEYLKLMYLQLKLNYGCIKALFVI